MGFLESAGNTAGTWRGDNGFRLMPDDDWFTAPASATVVPGVRDALVTIRYEWVHPDDGPQEGVLVVANAGDGLVNGLWIDTWHQATAQPLAAVPASDSAVEFDYAYEADWRWQIVVRIGDELRVTMRNVIPSDLDLGRAALAYDAMEMRLVA